MKWGNPGCAVKQCHVFALSMAKSELVLGLYHHWQHAYTQFGYPPNLRKKTPSLQNTSPGPVEERPVWCQLLHGSGARAASDADVSERWGPWHQPAAGPGGGGESFSVECFGIGLGE